MFNSFAHHVLWLFGLVVIIVLASLAIEMGVVTEAARDWQRSWFSSLNSIYGVNGDSIDRAFRVIGVTSSVVLGALGFSKAWHYAERNLPSRIADLMKRNDERHLAAREILVAPYIARTLRDVVQPSVPVGWWNSLLYYVKGDPVRTQTQRIMADLSSIDGEIATLNRRRLSCERQKATAHLLSGLENAVEAAHSHNDIAAQRDRDMQALRNFEQVLELNEHDLDGLEQAARQSHRLNADAAALLHLKKLARSAALVDLPIRQARALRFQAEILDERSTMASWNSARTALVTAIDVLDPVVSPGKHSHKEIELAAIYEALGSIQTKREKYTAAGDALDRADSIYKRLSDPDRRDGKSRVDMLRANLERVQKDKET